MFTITTDEGTDREIRWACRLTFRTKTVLLAKGTDVLLDDDGEARQRAKFEELLPIVVRDVVVGWEGVEDQDGKAIPWDPEEGPEIVAFSACVELAVAIWQRVIRGN